ERLVDAESVARGMVQDPERLVIAVDAPDMLSEPRVAELTPAKEEQARREPLERTLVVGLHEVVVILVIRDGEEIVPARLVVLHERVRCAHTVGERRVGVEVASEKGHQPEPAVSVVSEPEPAPGAVRPRRAASATGGR